MIIRVTIYILQERRRESPKFGGIELKIFQKIQLKLNIDRNLKLTKWQCFRGKKNFSQCKNALKRDYVAGSEGKVMPQSTKAAREE